VADRSIVISKASGKSRYEKEYDENLKMDLKMETQKDPKILKEKLTEEGIL
jgi:hypothetical protein